MKPKQISLTWTKNLSSPKEREDFEVTLRNSTFILSRLRDILKEQLGSLDRSESNDYDSPSWAYLQADTNGAKRELRRVLDLLSFLGDK